MADQLSLDANGNGQAPDGTPIVNYKMPNGVDVRGSGTTITPGPNATSTLSWGQGIINGIGNGISKLGSTIGSFFGGGSDTPAVDPFNTFLSSTYNMDRATYDQLIKNDPNLATSIHSNYLKEQQNKLLQDNMGIGWNMPTLTLGFNALNSLGNWWQAKQANSLARDQLDWQKDAWTKQYNLALEDRNRAWNARVGNRSAFNGNIG